MLKFKYRILYDKQFLEKLPRQKLSDCARSLVQDLDSYDSVSDIPREIDMLYMRVRLYFNVENEICMRIGKGLSDEYSELDPCELDQFLNIFMDPGGKESFTMHWSDGQVGSSYAVQCREFMKSFVYIDHFRPEWLLYLELSCFMSQLESMHFRKLRIKPLTLKELCRWHIKMKKLNTRALPKQLARFRENKHVLFGDFSLDNTLLCNKYKLHYNDIDYSTVYSRCALVGNH